MINTLDIDNNGWNNVYEQNVKITYLAIKVNMTLKV